MGDISIKYDTPIEVTKEQYNYIMREFSGLVAGRTEGDKYYIKVWRMGCAPRIELYLNNK